VQDRTTKGGGWCSERHYICIIAGRGGGQKKKYTAVKVHRQSPLVLLVKVCGKEGKALGSEDVIVAGNGL
jgi:hypothetical protein